MRPTLEANSPHYTEMIEEEKNSMPISRVETILGRQSTEDLERAAEK